MNLHQFLLILRARWQIAAFVLGVCVATAVALILLLPQRYTATVTVVADVRAPDPVAGMVLGAIAAPTWMPTQVDIVNSERVALKVVRLLGLDQNADIRATWMNETDGKGNLQVWLMESLKARLDVKPARDSNVIAISYESPDPTFSAAVANGFARAYMATNVEMKVEPARQTADWFQGQARAARETLEKTQARISEYQQQKGLVANDERVDVETARLAELSAQLSAIQALTADAASKQRAAGRQLENLPEALQNGLVINLRAQIATTEARLQEMAARVGVRHPDHERLAATLMALKGQLNAEMARIGRSFGAVRGASADKEAELRAAIDKQKLKLLELKHQRAELGVLLREGESAQRAYEAIAQRFTQTSLESQATQPSVQVLTPAIAPARPSSPDPFLYLLVALVGGGLAALLAAFGREIADRRVRTHEDLELQLGLPLLAQLGPRRRLIGWQDLAARLSGSRRRPGWISGRPPGRAAGSRPPRVPGSWRGLLRLAGQDDHDAVTGARA